MLTVDLLLRLCLSPKEVHPGYWQKLSGSGLYADVRAASFISRPPPYHENSGPRSVQFGLGPAGGLQLQPQDMNWKLATTSCSKQKTGETETDNWKDRKPAILQEQIHWIERKSRMSVRVKPGSMALTFNTDVYSL